VALSVEAHPLESDVLASAAAPSDELQALASVLSLVSVAISVATGSGVAVVSTAASSVGHLLDVPSELHASVLVSVGGVSVDVPPSAYTIVGPIALKIKTVMMANERKDERTLIDMDPPPKTNK
jgi:hypothetical protein